MVIKTLDCGWQKPQSQNQQIQMNGFDCARMTCVQHVSDQTSDDICTCVHEHLSLI